VYVTSTQAGDDDAVMNSFPVPSWSVAKVTRDRRFTGGSFVTMTSDELTALLRSFGLARAQK
jgi:hypothetical protein